MASIKLKHSSGNGTILNSPAANPSSDITLKLPSTTGSAGQVLKVASANHSSTNAELEFAADAGGKILQVKSASKEDVFSTSGSANGATDVTGLSVTMDAPASASSKYLVTASVAGSSNFVGASVLLNGTTTGQLLTGSSGSSGTNGMSPCLYSSTGVSNPAHMYTLSVLDSPNTTAVQTYKVQVYVRYVFQSGFVVYVNRPRTTSFSGQGGGDGGMTWPVSTITVMEVAG